MAYGIFSLCDDLLDIGSRCYLLMNKFIDLKHAAGKIVGVNNFETFIGVYNDLNNGKVICEIVRIYKNNE